MIRNVFFCIFSLGFCGSIFSVEQWIVVTTIQYPTPQLRKLSQLPDWHLVVVGDQKTPRDWQLENCEYLSPEKQLELGYELCALLPWNHYSRKNIGYLYAIEHGAKIIYETDDDNEPVDGLSPLACENQLALLATSHPCLNVYSYFGCPAIWPRGFPLESIAQGSDFNEQLPAPCSVVIEQGVVDGSPDVDAIFRLTQDREVAFLPKPACFLSEGVFCPFNSQNTFFHQKAFFTLYLPSFVSMRVSDIWRGYIAQKLIWSFGGNLAFSGPNAIQRRNDHSLLHDFSLEQALYLQGSSLVRYLRDWKSVDRLGSSQLMISLFQDLIQMGFLLETELPLLGAWLRDLERVRSCLAP